MALLVHEDIEDEGLGILNNHLPHTFEPFLGLKKLKIWRVADWVYIYVAGSFMLKGSTHFIFQSRFKRLIELKSNLSIT